MAVFFYPKSTITSQLFKLNGCRAGMRMDRGTFRENCVNLSGVGFRLKVCVHSPGEHLRLGCTAMWHTLARFLRADFCSRVACNSHTARHRLSVCHRRTPCGGVQLLNEHKQ